jgi:hypothetical protein
VRKSSQPQFNSASTDQPRQHGELGKAYNQRDEADEQAMVDQIKVQCQNLQTVTSELINIGTGLVASSDVEQSLSGFPDAGEAQLSITMFAIDNIKIVIKYTQFWGYVLFRCLLAAANRDVKLETAMHHELSAIPMSIFHEGGGGGGGLG